MVFRPTTDSSSDEEVTSGRQNRTARKSTAAQSIPSPPPMYTTRRQAAKIASKAIASSAFDKSMENFNPDMSQREKRKLTRKLVSTARRPVGALYDENGVHISTGLDLCDCLNENCPGCWFECEKCNSMKCGIDCRVFRKFVLDSVEFHGYDKTVKNPILLKQNM